MATTTTKPTISVTINKEIDLQSISDLLCGAFEGGSNYWYQIDEFIKPSNFANSDEEEIEYRHLSYPINEGGALLISVPEDDDGKQYRLDLQSIQKGLKLWAASEQYGHHFTNFIEENHDAETSDVFLQFCLFGDCIFG